MPKTSKVVIIALLIFTSLFICVIFYIISKGLQFIPSAPDLIWQQYIFSEDKISAKFPKTPEKLTKTENIDAERQMDKVSYSVTTDNAIYLIMALKYPLDLEQLGETKDQLDETIKRFAGVEGASIESTEFSQVDNHFSESFLLKFSKNEQSVYMKGLLIAYPKTIYGYYMVSSILPPPNYSTFSQSFKVLE